MAEQRKLLYSQHFDKIDNYQYCQNIQYTVTIFRNMTANVANKFRIDWNIGTNKEH